MEREEEEEKRWQRRTETTLFKPHSEQQQRLNILHTILLSHFVHRRKTGPKSSTLILAQIRDFGWLKESFSAKLCQHKLVTFNYPLPNFEENLYKFLRIIKERNRQSFFIHIVYVLNNTYYMFERNYPVYGQITYSSMCWSQRGWINQSRTIQCVPQKRKPINRVNFLENCNDLSEKAYIFTKFSLSSFFWHQLQVVLAMHEQALTISNGDVKNDLRRMGI